MCSAGFARFIVLGLNLILVILAVACLGFGIWLKVDDGAQDMAGLDAIAPSSMGTAAVLFIVIGLIIFLIAFFGCFGAWRKAAGFLLVYIIIVGLILLFQIVIMIVVATSDSAVAKLKESMHDVVNEYDSKLNDSLNALQTQFKCCGVDNLTDFENSNWWNNTKKADEVVPFSCCVMNETSKMPLNSVKCQTAAGEETPSNEYLHTEGCYQKLISWSASNQSKGIAFVVTLLLVQLIVWCAAIYLRIQIKKEEA